MTVLLFTIVTLSVLGILSAVVLYFVAQKFKVEEDPRIDDVEKMLPGANCGGCGFAGCRAMAEAMVREDDISSLYCPVGGGDCMKQIATYLGKVAPEKEPTVATVRCGGVCAKRPRTNDYNGAKNCAVAASLYVGETACAYGCLGYGDCVEACAQIFWCIFGLQNHKSQPYRYKISGSYTSATSRCRNWYGSGCNGCIACICT